MSTPAAASAAAAAPAVAPAAVAPAAALLKVPEAARLLGVSRRSMYEYCEPGGAFPSVRFGRSVRVRQADVLRALLGDSELLEAGR